MFEEAVAVANELVGKVSSIKRQRDNRRIRIANFYEKVGTCLEKISLAIDKNQSFDKRIEELETHLDSFSIAIGDIIGFELTERLVESLRTSFNEENFKKLPGLPKEELADCKKSLDSATEKFLDMWSSLQ